MTRTHLLALWHGLALCVALPVWAEELPATASETAQSGEVETSFEEGMATWYGGTRWHGRRTANGERFDRHALTAAHRSLPFGSCVQVLNLHNGQAVQVRINDRGPFVRNHVIDLSEAAARQLGFLRQGRVRVALHRCAPPIDNPDASADL